MYRFLISRRWIGFAIFVVVLAALCWRLGQWQFHRLDERKASNAVVEKHLHLDPVPLTEFTRIGKDVGTDDEWRPVSVTGTYDSTRQFELKYQSRDEGPGVDVITPLVLGNGNAILVDRGWIETQNTADAMEEIPAPPAGTVQIVGWLRPNSQGDMDQLIPSGGQVRGISSKGIAESVPYRLFNGFLNLREQTPASAIELAPEPAPSLGNGPHFFYALQWFFFGLLAIFGLFYFARTEARERSSDQAKRSSDQARLTRSA